MRTGEHQRYRTTFAGTSDIACVFVLEDLVCQGPGRAMSGPDVVPLSMTHLIKPISKLLRRLSLIVLVQSPTHRDEIP